MEMGLPQLRGGAPLQRHQQLKRSWLPNPLVCMEPASWDGAMTPLLWALLSGPPPPCYLDDFICSSEKPSWWVQLILNPVLQMQKPGADMPSKVAGSGRAGTEIAAAGPLV